MISRAAPIVPFHPISIIPPSFTPAEAAGQTQFFNSGGNSMADTPNQDFPTILGPDASFKGELSFEKGMRLHGKLEGKVNTPGRLHIAKEAKMQADVDAGAITVEGDVHGNLSASDRIELKQSARYEGDLRSSRLVVDEGAILVGHVTVGPDAVKNRPPQAAAKPQLPSATPQNQPVK
jgi:cytoskeletal protein CcmA (bactofilin family)